MLLELLVFTYAYYYWSNKNNDKCILSCAFGFSLVLILISHFCTELATKFQIGISTPWAQGSLKFLLILFLSARPCLLFHLYYLKRIILFSWASIMFSSIFGVMHIPNNSKIWHSCLVLNLTSKNHVSGISRGKKSVEIYQNDWFLHCFLNFCCCIYVDLGPNNKYFPLTDKISTHGTSAKGKKQTNNKQKTPSKTNKENLFSTLPYLPHQTNSVKIHFSYMKWVN